MTPLRQRFIEDMQLRGLALTTQRSYIHYVADFAKSYHTTDLRRLLQPMTLQAGHTIPIAAATSLRICPAFAAPRN